MKFCFTVLIFMFRFQRTLIVASLMFASTQSSFAQGIILNHDELRDQLNWLNQQGVIQLSTSTWPLSGTAIEQALQQADVQNPSQQQVLEQVQQLLQQQQQPLNVQLYASSDLAERPLQFDDAQQTTDLKANFQANSGSENWDARLNLNLEHDQRIYAKYKVNAEGSYLAGKLWNQWLVVGQIPTWWGQGMDGSLIRGDASRPAFGLTLQRDAQKPFESKWLSWLGAWQYQAFAGQLMNYTAVPETKLLGLRVTAQPTAFLELGASRAMQIAGEGRPRTAKAYFNAMIGRDNSTDNDEESASNQLAGIDFRLNFQPLMQLPVSVYGQMIGEDEAGKLPYKWMYQAGFDVATQLADKPLYLYAEWANTGTDLASKRISYAHSAYTDGYYQQGYSLGHGIGGDGEMYGAGARWIFDQNNNFKLRLLTAKVNQTNMRINRALPEADRIHYVGLDWTRSFPFAKTTLQTWFNDSENQGNDVGVGLKVDVPLFK